MSQTYDDEIELFEFFQVLWNGKWLISAFVALAFLLGGGFILSKDKVYESKVVYSIDTIPPFYGGNKASTDFQKKFYSIDVFNEWKKNKDNTSLLFDDFSKTEVLDGFVLTKDEGEPLAVIKDSTSILVKSNQLPILNDFYNYAEYINLLLKDEYVSRANDELKIIETRFKDLSSAESSIIQTVLSIDRYIASAEKGDNVLSIERPSTPKKVAPKSSLILALSLVLGGFIGAAYVLIMNAIKTRREQLAKA
jgi:LPS O-antigen subunit length determinant protein (WzzB/FepE family)